MKPTVAVVGAVPERSRFGNISVRAHRQMGYDVYCVNPAGGEVEGLPVYRTIGEVPAERLQRVTMYVRPQVGITLLEDIAAKGCDELWLNPGTESPELIAKAKALGLNPIAACSIVALGIEPSEVR